MAVAFDATSESHTGTTGSVSQASFSWTHTPSGTPKGVLIFVIQNNSSTDKITSVTYGGTTVPAVTGGLAAAATVEPRLCKAFFLGSGISTGAQTVVVNRTNDTTLLYAAAITVTAGADTEVYLPGIVLIAAVTALAEQNVDDGTTGVNSVRFAGGSFALNANPGGGANSTGVTGIDFGTEVCQIVREVTAGQGSRPVGFSNATSDDVAAVHLAVRELGPVNGTGTPSTVVGTGGVIGGVGYLDSYGDTYPADVTAAFGNGSGAPARTVGIAAVPAATASGPAGATAAPATTTAVGAVPAGSAVGTSSYTGYPAAVFADSPVGYWRLDDSSGTAAVDASGGGHPGTYSGSPTLSASSLLRTDANTAVTFDGSDDYVNLSNPSALRLTSAFTLESWIKIASGETSFASAICNEYDGARVNYFLGAWDGSATTLKPAVGFYTGSTWYICQAPTPITVNEVHHLVGTWDGTSLKIYVDGILANTTTPGTSPTTGTANYFIGSRWDNASGPHKFKGVLDEVAIYGSALSITRVRAHHVAGLGYTAPGDISGLKVWLRADAGAGAADNDAVATWTDQSQTVHSFTQATSGKRPLYKTNIQNGLPVVRFDGTDDVLTAGDLSASFPSAASVFAAVIQTGGTGKLMVYATKNNDSWWRFTGGDGYWGVFRSTRLAGVPGSGLIGSGWHVWSHTGNGTAYKMWVDRGIQINAGSYTYDGGNSHLIGWQETNNDYPAMDLGELIVYDTALSDVDRAKVEDYLFARWALSVAFSPTVAGVGAVPAAAVTAPVFASPSTVVGTGAVPAASGSTSGNTAPATVVGTGAVPAATGRINVTALPSAIAGTGAVPAATASGATSVAAAPGMTVGSGAVPAPTGVGPSFAAPARTVGIGAVPGPNVVGGGGSTANPTSIVGAGATPAVTALATSNATPSATAGVGAAPAATLHGTSVASPARVAGVSAVPAASSGGIANATSHPSSVVVVGRVPRAVAEGEGTGGGGGTPNGATDFWTLTMAS